MTTAALHEPFMRRALQQAMLGRGTCEPNPMVGCVLVKDGRIIGEGFHHHPGGPHAEPTALAACTEDPRSSTAYVTLEPCCHTNKRTPPCVPALLKAGVSRVVLGAIDPNPDVNGQGITQLRAAGVEVVEGVLAAECNQLLSPFIAATRYQRPYITLKFAQTADGVMNREGARLLITGPAANAIVHRLRSRSDAILVGGKTAVVDNPQLTVRGVSGPRIPLRCVLSHQARLSAASHLATAGPPTVFYSSHGSLTSDPSNRVTAVSIPDGRLEQVFPVVLADLHKRGVTHLLIEPGPVLLKGLLKIGLWDRLWQITSTEELLGSVGTPDGRLPPLIPSTCSGLTADPVPDLIQEFLNPRSDVFFANVPSADAVQWLSGLPRPATEARF
jgi:diaminohydroxyphosphoribosylaminopyrimidine deaminase / 5-amino-6-(5-phosphoribosylamino)uracil reductase